MPSTPSEEKEYRVPDELIFSQVCAGMDVAHASMHARMILMLFSYTGLRGSLPTNEPI